MHLLRRVFHLDGWQRAQGAVGAVAQQRFQAFERPQPARDAAIHQHAQQHAQRQQRQQHVGHQLTGHALLHGQAFGDLHAQALRCVVVAVVHFQNGHTHRLAVQRRLVDTRLACRNHELRRWRRQLPIAQHKLAGWRRHHVAQAVGRVLFQNVLRGARKINQQTRANRFDLPRQRPHRLRQRLVQALAGIVQRHAPGQHAAGQPQHQLR